MTSSPEERSGRDGGSTLPPATPSDPTGPSATPADLRSSGDGEIIDLRDDFGDHGNPPVPTATSWDLAWPELDPPPSPDSQGHHGRAGDGLEVVHRFDPLTDPLPVAREEPAAESAPAPPPDRSREVAALDEREQIARPIPERGPQRLCADDLLPVKRDRPILPRRGLRRFFGGASQPSLPPPPPVLDQQQRDLIEQIRTPLHEGHRVAVVSLKGGVGKTTVTAMLGSTLATHRIDRIVAIDANPDRGTLAEKIDRTTQLTVRDLITGAAGFTRFSAVQRYVHQTSSRLDIVASESDPAAAHAFDEADYAAAMEILERYYNVILTDCGTGLLHAATRAALATADSVIVVSSSSIDGARSAAATLDWLEAHGRADLAADSVAIINESRADSDALDLARIEEHFAARCRAVERIPYDPHLATGSVAELEELQPVTVAAFRRIAAAVVLGAGATSESRH